MGAVSGVVTTCFCRLRMRNRVSKSRELPCHTSWATCGCSACCNELMLIVFMCSYSLMFVFSNGQSFKSSSSSLFVCSKRAHHVPHARNKITFFISWTLMNPRLMYAFACTMTMFWLVLVLNQLYSGRGNNTAPIPSPKK